MLVVFYENYLVCIYESLFTNGIIDFGWLDMNHDNLLQRTNQDGIKV